MIESNRADEENIDEIVLGYLDRLNSGDGVDPLDVFARHPDAADQILRELYTFVDLGQEAAASKPLSTLGDFTLRREIGRGGMGVVYNAWQGSLKREVALKVLPPGIAADEKACTRFLREAQTAGKLNHRNVVAVHSTGVEEGTPWYSMEYVEGETLAQIISRLKASGLDAETPFGNRAELAFYSNLARAFAEVADGLQHAHSKGVIHRDVKPSNLILDSDGTLRILDFGLARLDGQESLTVSGDLMGTVLYMSPEQAMAKRIPLDHRTDLYSLGATMYEMLTGEPPFRGKDHHDTLSRIILHEPRSPRQLNPSVPNDVETIVLKCLRKDANDRYSSAEALAQDLRRFVRGVPIEARPPGRLERCWSWTRRRRAAIAVAAATLIVGLLAIVSLVQRSRLQLERAVREDTIPMIERLRDAGKNLEALHMATRALDDLPNDPHLRDLIDEISIEQDVTTTPSGADVFLRPIAQLDQGWVRLGSSPLKRQRIPNGPLHWKVTKEGYDDLVMLRASPEEPLDFQLRAPPDLHAGMARVPDGALGVPRFLGRQETLREYDLDRYEVTNEEYQRFVDAGGYENPGYWTDELGDDWRSHVNGFRDRTSSFGPATWESGRFLPGAGDYPVRGVSWYEAAAYAKFVGKRLPSIFHWYAAATRFDEVQYIVPNSNIGGREDGPVPVGTYQGIGLAGTFDMAGNVREWCSNEAGENKRYILGGSWSDPDYMFYEPGARSPFQRLEDFGFRCALYLTDVDSRLLEPIPDRRRDYSTERPCSEAKFEDYREHYSYDSRALNARIIDHEPVDGFPHETVTFDTVYDKDRIVAHLVLPDPGKFKPPYQTVVVFPTSMALVTKKLEPSKEYPRFFVESGRAVFLPVYYATYQRGQGQLTHPPYANRTRIYSDSIIRIAQDFSRSVDYLVTRPDIDRERLAYYSYSWGAVMGPVFLAADPQQRIKAAIFHGGGLMPTDARPEVDQIHFLPRVRAAVLMLNGSYDALFPVESSQKPMFDLLSEERKKHIVRETGHFVPRDDLTREATAWLDTHLGPVDAGRGE